MSALTIDVARRRGAFSLEVSFFADPGILALFGPSGAGKSTLLECVAGLGRPDRGEIRLGDRVLFSSERRIDCPPRRRRVGYVPQDGALFPHRTIAQNVRYAVDRGRGSAAAVAGLMEELDLAHLAARFPAEVSGGQARRASIARALAGEPELLLLDEPFVHLDRSVQTRLVDVLARAVARRGVPTILVTHDIDVLARCAARVAVIDGGRLIQQGTTEDVLFRPATSGVARMLGDVNLLAGVVRGQADGLWRVATGGAVWSAPHVGALAEGEAVELLIRASAVKLVREGAPLPPELSANLRPARLISADPRPDVVRAVFELEGGISLAAALPFDRFRRAGLGAGDPCRIALDLAGVSLFTRAR